MKKAVLGLAFLLSTACASTEEKKDVLSNHCDTTTFISHDHEIELCKGAISEDLLDRLSFIAQIKHFSRGLGINTTRNYTEFRDVQISKTLYELVVVPTNSLPWKRYVAKPVEEEGDHHKNIKFAHWLFSHKDDLADEFKKYEKEGHHLYKRESTDFSGTTAITPNLLANSPITIANIVLHEDFHATDRSIDPVLQESRATFFGFRAAIDFFAYDKKLQEAARERYDEQYKISVAINNAISAMRDLDPRDFPTESAYIERRAAILQESEVTAEMNEAEVWVKSFYTQFFPTLYRIDSHIPENLPRMTRIALIKHWSRSRAEEHYAALEEYFPTEKE